MQDGIHSLTTRPPLNQNPLRFLCFAALILMVGCATPVDVANPVNPEPEPTKVPEVVEIEPGPLGLHTRGEFVPTEWNTPLEEVFLLPPFKGSYDNSLSWKLLEAEADDCIAEIGCGYGGMAKNFRKTLGPNGKVLGRDISQKAIDRATRSGETEGVSFGATLTIRRKPASPC